MYVASNGEYIDLATEVSGLENSIPRLLVETVAGDIDDGCDFYKQ